MNCLREEHSLHIDDCVIWSDSKTVIQWLRSEHRRYKPFVQHRIAEILATTTTANWRWLPTEHNVADEATRANNFVDFSSSARWSCGPPFLLREEQYWPTESSTCNHHEEADKELRPKFALAIVSCTFLDYNRFSTFSKLVRTTAWVLRFIDVCRRRKPPDRCYGLTAKEVETAKLCLCRLVQRGEYAEEFQHIESGRNLPRTSSLIQLSPYMDEEVRRELLDEEFVEADSDEEDEDDDEDEIDRDSGERQEIEVDSDFAASDSDDDADDIEDTPVPGVFIRAPIKSSKKTKAITSKKSYWNDLKVAHTKIYIISHRQHSIRRWKRKRWKMKSGW